MRQPQLLQVKHITKKQKAVQTAMDLYALKTS